MAQAISVRLLPDAKFARCELFQTIFCHVGAAAGDLAGKRSREKHATIGYFADRVCRIGRAAFTDARPVSPARPHAFYAELRATF